ncbi:hypothetical protein SAMN05216419_101014 [Nitrosomonas cryotolerans]|uniref:Phosphoglycerate mutase n=1 Tax=Nitrosomonas cryotolerans ATCC 49181 TaxID=1131553 RepID=A0A1N6FHQ9_9PROT|nr:phosphoglycerate mutase [Nitrosomonas cryotolerans]SFP62621.1 hypothetical protein SAMN05216419_101014 [Nitrosomonas cryotolerans]SIN94795.1 hypothetical protein SAMN02743940_0256 [Nitrosomonas cryotolerans ATCC 49181]
MNLHLLIPALLWPDLSQRDIYHDLSLPTLEIILAKSERIKDQPREIDAWLCHTFGITKQQDWPVAPIMLQIDSPDKIKNSKDYWIRADPVHLRIEQNHIMLADSQIFQITQEEANQFAEVLNDNFNKDNLTFLPLCPDRWYVHTTDIPAIHTHSLSQMTCRNINNSLPFGQDSMRWHRTFNEIQMLLHEHPLNQARTVRGELAINSIWFWGGGTMPKKVTSNYNQIWSHDAFPRALAQASHTQHAELPPNASTWQQLATPGNHLVVLNSLLEKANYRNAYSWRENLKELERNWFTPLHQALQKGTIDQLTITSMNENSTLNFTVTRASLWKFWRPIKSLMTYNIT